VSAPLRARAGFTLAEVAVTIVIVGLTLVYVLQGLNTAMLTAAHTRNIKLARELGLFTLGQIESGLLRDEIETGMSGNYADEGQPDFAWEIRMGEDSFRERESDAPFDSWAKRDARTGQLKSEAELQQEEDEEEDAEEPFEKVKVRVTFPRIQELSDELVLERWIPWKQVYGEAEAADGSTSSRNKKASKGAAAETPAGATKP
jgi:prepilin-type N-terminal cleavage/methylation domain-containing protein